MACVRASMLLNIHLHVHSNQDYTDQLLPLKKSASHSRSLFRKQEKNLKASLNANSYGVNIQSGLQEMRPNTTKLWDLESLFAMQTEPDIAYLGEDTRGNQ